MKSEELRKELYKKLREHHGAIGEVATRLNMHRTTVSLVLRGGYDNVTVLEMAATVLKEYEAKAAQQRLNTATLLGEAMVLATA